MASEAPKPTPKLQAKQLPVSKPALATGAPVRPRATVVAAAPPKPADPIKTPVPVQQRTPVTTSTSVQDPVPEKTSPTVQQKPISQPSPEFQLPGAVYSPQLLESVIYDIQYYLDWYRQNQIRSKVGAKPKDEPNHSDETVVVIETWLGGKPATLESIEDLLAHLKNLKLPQVHIMLAALPNRSQRESLVGWFRANVGPGLLLSFVADRNLGGGLVVRTPNRVFDYTWKQQLVAARSKLAEILKRV
jgi:hypothetical protein